MSVLLAALCSYQVALAGDGTRLDVQARLPAGSGGVLSVARGAVPFVVDVRVDGVPLQEHDGAWVAPSCRRGCRVSYRFDLSRAADAGDAAERSGGLTESPPQGWLLRPEGATRLSVRVAAPAPLGFAAGLPQRDGAFEIASDDLPFAAPAVFGPMQLERIPLGAQTLQVALAPQRGDGLPSRPRAALLRFITAQARAVADYFGRLPVDQTLLLVRTARGSGSHGRTLGGGGATVFWELGEEAPLGEGEWVLVHELVHTGFPDLQRVGQHWAEEGLSTYVEPVARARAGLLSPAKVWRDLVEGLPRGAPVAGGEGLDRSPTWGSTYWGGALFWLLADLRIREQTGGRRSLEDALRGLTAAGGTVAVRWTLLRALQVGDEATGTRALEELYSSMGETAGPVDLPGLFRGLGVAALAEAGPGGNHRDAVPEGTDGDARAGEPGRFDDHARLARLRAAITARR